jgi:hypothetical protein
VRYRPADAELLAVIAELLEDEILGQVPPALQHKVRVAANLTRILARQQELEPAAWARERNRLSALLGRESEGVGIGDLRAELDRRLRDDDPTLAEQEVWAALVDIARDDLATAKPGYDAWSGE